MLEPHDSTHTLPQPCYLLQVYTPDNSAAAQVVMVGLSDLAMQLQAAACEGSDPALVLPLPHTKLLLRAQPGERLMHTCRSP